MFCTIEPNIIKKIISSEELLTSTLHTAEAFYNDELKWDALLYVRSITFDFQIDNPVAINTWYKKLITRIPEYLYYLADDDFIHCMNLIVDGTDSLLLASSRYSKFYFENAVHQIAAFEDELIPLVEQVCDEISHFPVKEVTSHDENGKVSDIDSNRYSNVIWLYRRRRKLNR